MVSGHPLLTGLLQTRLTLQFNVSVFGMLIVGGEGTSNKGSKRILRVSEITQKR